MATVEIPEEMDKVLSELAKKTGKTKADILKEIFESISEASEDDLKESEKLVNLLGREIHGEGDVAKLMKDVAIAKVYMRMLDGGDNVAKAMQPLLYIALIKQLTRPDPYELVLLEKVSKSGNEDFKKFLEEYKKTEEEKWRAIYDVLLKSKSEEERKELISRIEELHKKIESKEREEEKQEFYNLLKEYSDKVSEAIDAINQRIGYLESSLQNAQGRNDIVSQIQQLKQLRESLKEIADVLGFKKPEAPPPTTKEGKVDWGQAVYNLIKDGMEKVTEIIKVMKQSPPPMQEPQEYYPQEVNESYGEEVKEESKSEEAKNVDDNVKVPGCHFATLKDLKEKLGRDVYVKDNGTVAYVDDKGNEVQLTVEQLREIDDQVFKEKLERGEIKYNVGYKSFEELLKDEKTLQAAYAFAEKGTRIVLDDGTDVTEKVLQVGKERGYKTIEEMLADVSRKEESEAPS